MGKNGGGGGKSKPAAALAPAELARVLQKIDAGKSITESVIRADIAAGAPVNVDGTVDLVKYTAWLLRRHGYGKGDA